MIGIAHATTETEFVFQQAVEGLFCVGLRGKMTPQLQSRLSAVGLDLTKKLEPAYPRSEWNEFIRVTAETLWPDVAAPRAYHALGRQLLAGYSETLVGKALTPMLRLIGPRRTLQRMTHNFRSGGNYNLCRVQDVGPNEVLFWLNEPHLHPSYAAGILEAALEIAGAKNIDIQIHTRDAEGCTYRVVWT